MPCQLCFDVLNLDNLNQTEELYFKDDHGKFWVQVNLARCNRRAFCMRMRQDSPLKCP